MKIGHRPKKYHTEAERKEARRIQARDCKRRRMELVRVLRESKALCRSRLCLMEATESGFCRCHTSRKAA